MAYRTGGVCLNQDAIAFTVIPDFPHFDVVARGLSFVPEFLTATAEEPDIVAGEGSAQGFLIHVTEHEHFTGIGILDDGRD